MNKLIYASSAFIGAIFLHAGLGIPTANAQAALPVCSSIADDADGDGFGWVRISSTSCVVTDATDAKPEIINQATGQPVILERAYWDGNADLINRNISCQFYELTEGSPEYSLKVGQDRWYQFAALPGEAPFISFYSTLTTEPVSIGSGDGLYRWTIVDGVFDSQPNLEFFQDNFPATDTPWLERTTRSDGQSAVRFWTQPNGSEFSECVDTSGATLEPTGHWDRAGTTAPSPYIETPINFTGEQEPQPVIVNRETGQQVALSTGTWEFKKDLAFTRVACIEYDWNEGAGIYRTNDYGGVYQLAYFPPIRNAIQTTIRGAQPYRFDGRDFSDTWSITDNTFDSTTDLISSMWYEPITSNGQEGVRYWGRPTQSDEERSNEYTDCYASKLESIYIWQTTSIDSFRPDSTTTPVIAECVDTDPANDGWGWNGIESCRVEPLIRTCIDNDGDGWGWDGVQSCFIESEAPPNDPQGEQIMTSVCIDSDGDGWGWDGTQSCVIEPVLSTCVDSDGDGWGWDGSKSCLVE